jgi:hypothetical protein
MNTDAILALIADLYAQLQTVQIENNTLRDTLQKMSDNTAQSDA